MTSKDVTAEETSVEEKLSPEQIRARERLKKLIEEQGTKPLSVDELRAMGDVWPEDESVDEFLAERERWRSESRNSAATP
ncbi:MAG: hypothetical protein AB1631_11635 [Acidobacteriota bacterium]